MEYIDVLWKHAVPAVCRFVSVPRKSPFFLKSLEIEIKAGAVWWLVGNLRVFLVSKPIRLETTVELSCAPRYSTGWWLWCFQCKQFWGEYTVFLSLLFWQMFFVEDWESSSAAKVYWIFVWLRKQTMSFLVIRGLGRNTFNMSLWNDPLTWGPCLFSGGVDFFQNVSQSFQHCYVLTLSHWNLVNSKSLQMVKLLVGAHVSA